MNKAFFLREGGGQEVGTVRLDFPGSSESNHQQVWILPALPEDRSLFAGLGFENPSPESPGDTQEAGTFCGDFLGSRKGPAWIL